MDRAEKCFFCERPSPEADLVAWFVQDERRTTHTACWLEAYRSTQLRVGSSADSGQPIEEPGPDLAAQKTLDDIRRELEAEYAAQSDAAEMRVHTGLDEDARIIEHHRSASRRRRRRRYAMGGIAGSVLLVASYVAVTRGMIPLAAFASAPDVTAPKVARPDAERISPNTSAARPAAREPRDARPAAVPVTVITELERQVKALRSELQALAAKLEGSDSRIAGMESRVSGVESSMRRLAEDVASAAAIRAAERPVAAPSRAAERPVVGPRQTAGRHGSSSPSDVRPVAETDASPEPQAASTTTHNVAATRGGSAVSDNASRPSAPPTFKEKLRADWRTIKQGFASAGDELKAGMRDLTRKIAGE